ncbi:MAG: arylsulfotransferase family protein [Gammaproteobacteria bacterium]|jgi:hypothetical protein|nr:arylsulfotransferase family protein [Gammaproteobacteria bacterium]MDP7153232.1 arylsulfotransferase family protein [Gammaproteobacteria bacterium]HJP04118.1 arylsulfotransferase family protein [Gammaproteobacteria bacterium]
MKDWLGLAVFILALCFLAFLLGSAVVTLKIFPYSYINSAFSAANELVQRSREGNKSQFHFINKARYEGEGVTVHDPAMAQPGITLVTSHWLTEGEYVSAIRLINLDGNVLHEWQIHPDEIWPVTPYDDYSAGKYNQPQNYVHGTHLLPNGDIVFNIEYLGLIRMNACSDILWKLPYRTHHSVDRDDDGNFWVAGLNWRENPVDGYVHMKPPFVDETMLKVSPDGDILDEVFFVKEMYKSGYADIFSDIKAIYDFTHMNDVEILDADMADAFSMFSAGDIMISLRHLSLVVIFDGKTREIKWHFRHPMIHQHDPDFEADGHIVIFDNQDDTTLDGSLFGHTRLLKVDPVTKQYEVLYPARKNQPLYTKEGGKHQLLPNGNRLITEAHPGRVLEVTPEGETVWNWIIGRTEGNTVAEVLEGTRYPSDYLNPENMNCAID